MAAKYLRCKATIRTLSEDGNHTDQTYFAPDGLPSISAAKRKSRELQLAAGGLGRGSLKVVDSFKGES